MNKYSSAYSVLKIFHHTEVLEKLKNNEHITPIHIQIIPTNRCNQACSGCAYRLKGYASNESFVPQDEIRWGKLQEIVLDCKKMGVQAIQLTGGGEPTLHPYFLNLCNLILSQDISLGLVTNGMLWSDNHVKILSKCKWIRFSIDAGSEQVYSKYRHAKPQTFHKVRNHIRQLTSVTQAEDTIVGVGFVINNQNWHEVVKAAKNAKDDGADNFRISALFQNEGVDYFTGFYEESKQLCHEAAKLTDETFQVFNLFGDRLSDLNMSSPDYSFCGMSKLSTYLGADQKAYTCCMNAYNQHGLLGDFTNQSFKQMWFSDIVQSKLIDLNAKQCTRCMYNNKNKTILYAIESDPLHVEFI